MAGNEVVLKLENITKVFPGVKALDDVHFELRRGEVHALCGENGAGKSTLMKIISGAQEYTSGNMEFEGNKVAFSSTEEAQNAGISMIYQEFNLIPYLSVGENIFIGRHPMKRGFIDWKRLMEESKKILTRVGLGIDPRKRINQISVAEAQMVEIAKCLSMNSKVIIMDEPTAALTDDEIKYLFEIIENLKKQGISIIYISHRLEEIFRICDRITVFRDGKYIRTMNVKETDYDELVSLMVGKDLTHLYPERLYEPKDIILEMKNISYKTHLKDVSFKLHRGEILGIAGLIGSGNIQLAKLLFGAYNKDYSGTIEIGGKGVKIEKPLDAIRYGISLVPDDRKNEGLVLIRSVKENISLASMDSILEHSFIKPSKESDKANKQIKNLGIRVYSQDQTAGNLSGGNQQKVVFGKMLETMPEILVLAEPTRGIDVGAKAEIYKIMGELTQEGISIILVSSELPELIGMSDRILVMREGKIVAELLKEELSQETVLAYAAGGKKK